jgi:cell division protease FtsH
MKETLAGALLGLIVFLAFIGINVTPLILITLLLGGFYFFYLGRYIQSGGSGTASSCL